MFHLKSRSTTLGLRAVALAALGAAIVLPGVAHASWDEPWPKPPSCSNETGTCTSMEDLVAYECYFENPESPFHFCDDPFEELMKKDTQSLTTTKQTAPVRTLPIVVKTASR